MLYKGKFISLEGIDGCGKGTQKRLLENYLDNKGIDYIETREPGGTELSEDIRTILKHKDYKSDIDPVVELLLFNSARRQLMEEVINPALRDGKSVLSDRFADSTIAYQGYAGALDPSMVKVVCDIATEGKYPNLTLLFDVDPKEGWEIAVREAGGKGDRIERKGWEYQARVRKGYLELARQNTERIKIIPRKLIEEVHAEVIKYVDEIL